MDLASITLLLDTNAHRIAALVSGLSEDQSRWQPAPGEWSILEIVNHLLDEERLDFRLRLDYVLHRPGEHFPPNTPERWPTEHHYLERRQDESLQAFLAERRRSLEWLAALESPAWDMVHTAQWGSISAGEFLASWPAHDVLHMRQIIGVLWALTNHLAAPYATGYAGPW